MNRRNLLTAIASLFALPMLGRKTEAKIKGGQRAVLVFMDDMENDEIVAPGMEVIGRPGERLMLIDAPGGPVSGTEEIRRILHGQ